MDGSIGSHGAARRAARMAALLLAGWLAACGGGGDGAPAPAPVVVAPPVIGSAGGEARDPGGASVIVPPGALDKDVTIRIAVDATGAPALPPALQAAGPMHVVTPHGGAFAQPVEVRIPVPAATLQPNQELKLAKAQPGGDWEVLGDSVFKDGQLSARVGSFSYFVPVLISYPLSLTVAPPLAVTSSSLVCAGLGTDCRRAVGTVTATYTVTTNGGQLPSDCTGPGGWRIEGADDRGDDVGRRVTSGLSPRWPIALDGGSVTKSLPRDTLGRQFETRLACNEGGVTSYRLLNSKAVRWQRVIGPDIAVASMPDRIDVVAGADASLTAILMGGAATPVPGAGLEEYRAPSAADRATIDWQRSGDGGTSWRTVARSYQDEADPRPLPDGWPAPTPPWALWAVRHGFVAAATDHGALLRVIACYSPPDGSAARCATSAAARVQVLSASALPVVLDAPRSMLVRTGQTASFSAVATGLPAPALQWQTRAANDAGAWTDLVGATGTSHTTPATTLADNGRQFRVVARNAVGEVASAPAIVSVSDVDVAPTIVAQPAALAVLAGSDAAFAIAARGTEALSYQWRRDGIPIADANAPLLRLAAVDASRAGAYTVEVRNAAGSVVSDAAALTVSAAVPAAVAPTIVTPPAAASVGAGSTATLAVGAAGTGPLAYQWLKDGAPIAGATAAFHHIAAAAAGDAGSYAVRVSNAAGSVTSVAAALTVTTAAAPSPVSLTSQPSPQVRAPGESAIFAAGVTGSGPLSYQWSKDGSPITGATSAVLVLPTVTGFDAGAYRVTVGNALGAATSDPATLTVLGAPAIAAQPASTSVVTGATATFAVGATGSALRFQWTRNHVAIDGATAATYTTPPLTIADSGAVYGVVVYNGAGVAISAGAMLAVTDSPTAGDVVAYFWDFDSPEVLHGGIAPSWGPTLATAGVQGFAGLGPAERPFAGQMLRAGTATEVTLTLTGLPPHSAVTLQFLLAAIDSLDGAGVFPAGDYLHIKVDGVTVFREALENSGAGPQTWTPDPAAVLARKVDLGFGGPGGWFVDSAYDMSVEPRLRMIPHTGSTLTLSFVIEGEGVQTLDDESWGMDNLRIVLHP